MECDILLVIIGVEEVEVEVVFVVGDLIVV